MLQACSEDGSHKSAARDIDAGHPSSDVDTKIKGEREEKVRISLE